MGCVCQQVELFASLGRCVLTRSLPPSQTGAAGELGFNLILALLQLSNYVPVLLVCCQNQAIYISTEILWLFDLTARYCIYSLHPLK